MSSSLPSIISAMASSSYSSLRPCSRSRSHGMGTPPPPPCRWCPPPCQASYQRWPPHHILHSKFPQTSRTLLPLNRPIRSKEIFLHTSPRSTFEFQHQDQSPELSPKPKLRQGRGFPPPPPPPQ